MSKPSDKENEQDDEIINDDNNGCCNKTESSGVSDVSDVSSVCMDSIGSQDGYYYHNDCHHGGHGHGHDHCHGYDHGHTHGCKHGCGHSQSHCERCGHNHHNEGEYGHGWHKDKQNSKSGHGGGNHKERCKKHGSSCRCDICISSNGKSGKSPTNAIIPKDKLNLINIELPSPKQKLKRLQKRSNISNGKQKYKVRIHKK